MQKWPQRGWLGDKRAVSLAPGGALRSTSEARAAIPPAGERDGHAVMAVADGVGVAHAYEVDRGQGYPAVLGKPHTLPAGAGCAGRAEAAIEEHRARGLDRPSDRGDRDLADGRHARGG